MNQRPGLISLFAASLTALAGCGGDDAAQTQRKQTEAHVPAGSAPTAAQDGAAQAPAEAAASAVQSDAEALTSAKSWEIPFQTFGSSTLVFKKDGTFTLGDDRGGRWSVSNGQLSLTAKLALQPSVSTTTFVIEWTSAEKRGFKLRELGRKKGEDYYMFGERPFRKNGQLL